MPPRDESPKPAASSSPPTPAATTPGAGAAPPSPPASSPDTAAAARQAALDKEAASLQEKADAEAEKAAELAAAAEKAENAAEDFGQPRAPRCPDCGERMEVYTGGDINPHKLGTAFCPTHGRKHISRNRVID